jgi:hypothetical protein
MGGGNLATLFQVPKSYPLPLNAITRSYTRSLNPKPYPYILNPETLTTRIQITPSYALSLNPVHPKPCP